MVETILKCTFLFVENEGNCVCGFFPFLNQTPGISLVGGDWGTPMSSMSPHKIEKLSPPPSLLIMTKILSYIFLIFA